MQIRLENIGIIKDSTLFLDGLTVVTGKNNSGKTTVGKALYSVLDAVCNLRQKNSTDKLYYVRNCLFEIASFFDTLRFIRFETGRQKKDFFASYPALKSLSQRNYRINPSECNEQFVCDLVDELRSIHLSEYFDEGFLQKTKIYSGSDEETEEYFPNLLDSFEKQRKQALSMLEKLLDNLNKDLELIDYARESINQTLQVEFAKQIQPVKADAPFSRIRLVNEDSLLFDVSIEYNRVVDDGNPVFFSTPFKKPI